MQDGISVNGWVALVDNLRLVARYDNYDPNTASHTTVTGSDQTLVVGALDWSVRKNVHIMPNIEYTHYSIGNAAGDQNDFVARATLYFSF